MAIDFTRRSLMAPKLSLMPKLPVPTRCGRSDNKVVINVGGIRYETYKTTLKNIPDTRLSWLTDTNGHYPDYDSENGEYFFDRHPGVFNMILNYYRTGKLHVPTDVCGPLFEEELAFWGLDEKQIEPCCWSNYRAHRDAQDTLAEFAGEEEFEKQSDTEEETVDVENIREKFGIIEEAATDERSRWCKYRPRVWNLLDNPKSSRAAKIYAMVSVAFILTSIMVFCFETHSLFRYTNIPNVTISELSVREKEVLTQPFDFLVTIEYICIAFFTIEIILRLLFCPCLREYFKQPYNWIDLMAIIPFYINIVSISIDPMIRGAEAFRFLNALRLIRIFRIFKLTRQVSGLKILVHTIKASARELLLLILVLIIGVLIFACLVYYAEQIDESKRNDFSNIPIGFWWAVVTMTTLGYGEIVPRTAAGYIVGTVCAVCGLLMLSLPVPIIVNNFTLYYSQAQARMKLPKKSKPKMLLQAANALKEDEPIGADVTNIDERMSSTENLKKVERHDSLKKTGSQDSAIGSVGSPESKHAGICVIFTDEDSQRSMTPIIESDTDSSPGLCHVQPNTDSGLGCGTLKQISVQEDSLVPLQVNSRKRRVSTSVAPAASRRRSLFSMTNVHI